MGYSQQNRQCQGAYLQQQRHEAEQRRQAANNRAQLVIFLLALPLTTAFAPSPYQAVSQASSGDWKVLMVASRLVPGQQGKIWVVVIYEGARAPRSIVGVRFDWGSDNPQVDGLLGQMAQTVRVTNVQAGKPAWSKALVFPAAGMGRLPSGPIRVRLEVDPENMDAEANENNVYYARCKPSSSLLPFTPCARLSSW